MIDLNISGTKVGSFSSNAGGSLIVDENESVSVSLEGESLDFSFKFLSSLNEITILEDEKVVGVTTNEAMQLLPMPSNITVGTKFTVVIDDSNTYITVGYWDTNSSNDVLKYEIATGNVIQNGANSSYGAQPIYGGDNYMYWMYSNNLYRMRTDDASAEEVNWVTSLSGYPNTTYPLFGTNGQEAPNNERCLIMCNSTTANVYAHILNATTGAKIVDSRTLGAKNSGFWLNFYAGGPVIHPHYSVAESKWKLIGCSDNGYLRVADLPGVSGSIASYDELQVDTSTPQVSVLGEYIYRYVQATGEIIKYDFKLNELGVFYKDDLIKDIYGGQNGQIPIMQISTPTQVEIDARDYSNIGAQIRLSGLVSQ